MTTEEDVIKIEEKIKVIANALLEKERIGQLSPTTIQELKWIA
jgi:hypothetical protein